MANKIMFGADLIDVLKNKYNMNKLGEVPTKYKNGVTTIDFIYGKEKDIDDLKYNKPYVEFSIDDETDGFISGTMYPNGGVEGIQFDSWEDLKYFMKNAKWTESRKSMKEEIYDIGNYTYPKVVTVDNVDKILKSVRDGILDGYRFNCENINIADLVYSDSFQKYFLNGGKIEWGKVKKSPFNGELVVLGKLIGNNYYDINIALESKENPFGYSKISHFNFFKKFDWVESNKSTRKILKEGINDELIATSFDGETTLYISDERQANHGKDPHYEFKLGENDYFTRYIRCDDEDCEKVVLDWIKEFDLDISKSEISKIIKLHESKKSVRKSMKESRASLHKSNVEYGVERIKNKVKGSDVTYYFDDEDCFIDVTEKNGNLWAFTIDFGSDYVYMIEPKEDRGSFGADNEAFDVIISMLQGKRFNE